MPDDMIRFTILTQTNLFPGVSLYFDSADKGTAQLGAVMAEAISGRTGDPVHTGLLDNFPDMQQLKALASTADLFTGKLIFVFPCIPNYLMWGCVRN